MRDSQELAREFPDVEELAEEAKLKGAVFRFHAVPDDAFFSPLTFDVLEAREGSLRFIEPSKRAYGELAAIAASLVVLFFLPYLVGLLPWSLLEVELARDTAATAAYSFDARAVSIGFLLLVLVGGVAAGVSSPRLMAHHPRVTESVHVKEKDDGTPVSRGWQEYRLLLDVPGSSFWVRVRAKSDQLQRALEFAERAD